MSTRITHTFAGSFLITRHHNCKNEAGKPLCITWQRDSVGWKFGGCKFEAWKRDEPTPTTLQISEAILAGKSYIARKEITF